MHVATKALVLRGVDYKESDKILTLLTQDQGKLTASARGCRKKGSPLAAGCQLLSWGELVLYDYQGRWTVKEAAPERLFQGVRDDLDKLALACYFAEVIELLAVEGEPNPQLLSLILNSLLALVKLHKPLALVKAAFELKAMCLAGYEPLLEGCAVCGARDVRAPMLDIFGGFVTCGGCKSPDSRMRLPLTEGGLAALRHVLGADGKRLYSFTLEKSALQTLDHAGEAFIAAQLERSFRTLDYYKSLLG